MKNGKAGLYITGMAAVIMMMFTGCGKKYVESAALNELKKDFSPIDERQLSLEKRDYVIKLTIDEEAQYGHGYKFTFELADLTEYKGDAGNMLKTSEYACEADCLEGALDKYYKEKERQLDLGHMSDIIINNSKENVKSNQLIFEMGNLPGIAKSVPTTIVTGGKRTELILREVIKNVYAGEDF